MTRPRTTSACWARRTAGAIPRRIAPSSATGSEKGVRRTVGASLSGGRHWTKGGRERFPRITSVPIANYQPVSPTASAIQPIVRVRDRECVGVGDLVGHVHPLAERVAILLACLHVGCA